MNYKIYVNRWRVGWMVTALAFLFWALIPWFYFAPPELLFGSPLALIGFGLLLFGLVFLVTGGLLILQSLANRLAWAQRLLKLRALLILAVSLAILTPYLLSPLAPNWGCATAPIQVAIANAQGQNCTETCTNWDGRPCGGWSSCFNKNISCSSSGIDQNGRSCQGCCFACKIVCDEPTPTPVAFTPTPILPTLLPPTPTLVPSTPTLIPPTPTPVPLPPTVSSSLACDIWGGDGWCRKNARLIVTASDPQGASVSITGASPSFSCLGSCTVSLPAGRSVASYTATSSASGLSASGSRSWAYDPIPPTASLAVNGTDGLNGWYTSSVMVTANATDALSGVESVRISSGGAWAASLQLTQDGTYPVQLAAVDVAGNTTESAQTIRLDATAPSIFISAAGSLETSGWFSSPVQLSATATDVPSGVDGNVLVSINGGDWQALPLDLTQDGLYSAKFRVFDLAGNKTDSQISLKVDTTPPSLSVSETGDLGQAGWYVSNATVSASASDALSGVVLLQHRLDAGAWADGGSVVVGDGLHTVQFQASDAAGNLQTISREVRVDTTPPVAAFEAALSNSVLSGSVHLSGTVSDVHSGVDSIEFSADGLTWLPASVSSASWNFMWNTLPFKNGRQALFLRARDVAGNLGEPVQGSAILDNYPPYVSLSETWNVWESGSLVVQPNVIPLKSVRVLVKDPLLRYPDVVISDKNPALPSVSWDRVIGQVVAPPGIYTVIAEACDLYGLCSKDSGTITIPVGIPLSTSTPTPAPTYESLSVPPAIVTPQSTPPQLPPQELPMQSIIVAPTPPEMEWSIWPVIVVAMLLFMFSFLLLFDPRPIALRSLARALQQARK